jgi:hypothetical protein
MFDILEDMKNLVDNLSAEFEDLKDKLNDRQPDNGSL